MKAGIFITLFFLGIFNSIHAFDFTHYFLYPPFPEEYKGIKKITEKSSSHWKSISFFDETGHLLRQTHAYRKEMMSDFRFNYTVTDTLIEIRRLNTIYINYDSEKLRIYQYLYNASNQCSKHRVCFSNLENPVNFNFRDFRDNFVYKDEMLISCIIGGNQYIYEYNGKKQIERILEIYNKTDTTFFIYMYNESGQLTDCIQESNNAEAIYADAPPWSETRSNKIHIRFADFDRRGNWRKSYFITEKRIILKSKRRIQYR
ncbi:MAG: hypothetical protein LBE91_21385 [Tannerella sp.]|jgi:hypothetical protein|nr:hypothetical protein [Tannerella sp.]